MCTENKNFRCSQVELQVLIYKGIESLWNNVQYVEKKKPLRMFHFPFKCEYFLSRKYLHKLALNLSFQ